jgi:DNA recombination protein RmuC
MNDQMLHMKQAMQDLHSTHHRLSGGMEQMTSSHTSAQARLLETLEKRLDAVSHRMGESLEGSSTKTARSLGELQQRLEAIDKAQTNIESLSNNVLSLQDILSNKQARGAFGEIQLMDIISKALPSSAFEMQATLSNGKRADCIIYLPYPPGSIVVDSKFPLESYQQMVEENSEQDRKAGAQAFRTAMKKHIADIASRYIIAEETADCALMFLPSEAVYAELHARFTDLVNEGFKARVFIVSPSTLMAMLNTMRAVLKDARMREQTSLIRKELSALFDDVGRLVDRVEKLDTHFEQAAKDIKSVRVSANKISRRSEKLESLEFDDTDSHTRATDLIASPRSL